MYNFIILFRWILIVFLSIIWRKKPRNSYGTILFIDFVIVILTLVALPSFNKPSAILILVSEILLLFRHFAQLMVLFDFFKD